MPRKPKSKSLRKKTKPKKSALKKSIWIVGFVLLLIAMVVFGYFLGQKSKPKTVEKKSISKEISKTKTKKPSDLFSESKKTVIAPREQNIPTNDKNKTVQIKKRIEKEQKKYSIVLPKYSKKAKLAIVIDDIYSKRQLDMIKDLHIKVTPSIFPPFVLSKESHHLAKNLKHYMIHLPMESANKQYNRHNKTLMTSFSDEEIADRVMELRRLFPSGKYINSHTGSVFTSNYYAMKRLYAALRMEGFVFVDSFTKASSKVEKIAHEYGDMYIRRDIFIDNTKDIRFIKKQLRLAVQKAKKNGYAVAIGHPHKATMKALKESKSILKDVELVYIDEITKADR